MDLPPLARRSPRKKTPPEERTAVGRAVEAHVAAALTAKGYAILAQNFRNGRDEIDLLAKHEGTLVLLEVRYRREGSMTPACTTITKKKADRLRKAALRLASKYDCPDVRVDVVAVDGNVVELYPNAVEFTST